MESTRSSSSSSEAVFSASYVTPLLISLAGVGTAVTVLVIYHFLMTRFCLGRRDESWLTSDPPTAHEATVATGVEKHVLNSLPILSYTKKRQKHQTDCVVCLGELTEGEKIRFLPSCGHFFHVPCIDDWFSAHTSCPICRGPIAGPSVDHEAESESGGRDHDRNLNLGGHDDDDQGGGGRGSGNGLLVRHGLSLILDGKKTEDLGFVGMRRSLSMDDTSCNSVVINIDDVKNKDLENGTESSCGSSSSSSSSSGHGTRSMWQLDRMSSRLLRSLSQMRVSGDVDDGTLPS